MARTLGEIVQRGVASVLANWPLLLIRIAEGVALIALMIGIVAAAVVPLIAAGIGGSFSDAMQAVDIETLLGRISPLLVIYALIVISIALALAMFAHAFVQGGIVGCYLEAERLAPAGPRAPRDAFRVFTPELWWSEGKRNVWRFFWIYNVIWGAYSLAMLLPLLPLVVLVALFPENPASIVLAVVGLVAVLILMIGVAFVVVIWSQVVLIDAARRNLGVFESLAAAREAIRGRTGTIVLVGGIFFALSMAVGSFVAGFSFFVEAAREVPGAGVALIPVRIALSLINSAVSALFGCWLLAALVAALAPGPAEVRHDVVSR
jgi:hypothetical protein